MAGYKIIEQSLKTDTCLECGTVFYGRANKVFCCESCKNRYHNRRRQELRNMKMRLETILGRNYSILSDLISMNRFSVSRQELLMMGYRPEYVTSVCREGRRELYSCYDISFYLTPAKICNIHRVPICVRPGMTSKR